MISIEHENNLITASVFGEFTLADFQNLEQQVAHQVEFQGKVNLLIDLSDMTGYTLDVAREDLKFSRRHAYDFEKIAVVTDDQWLIWSAWVSNLFIEAEVRLFENVETAKAWLGE
jgi:hypothetical protein